MSSRKGLTASYVGFFTAGFTIAAWAPLIPFVKEALQASPSSLGILLRTCPKTRSVNFAT